MLAHSRRLLAALFLAYAFSLYGALGGLPGEPEHELHLFLASHYAQDYFPLNDPRGENGFSVAGHPPLCHQLVALLSQIPRLNIERAYAILTVAAALLLVVGAWLFVGCMSSDWNIASNAALAVSLYPCLYLFLFPFGQLPFMLSTALGLGAAAAIGCAVQTGSSIASALAGALAVASITAHPLGVIPVAMGILLSVFVRSTQAPRAFFGPFVSLAAAAQILFVVLMPFLDSIWKQQARPLSLSKLHFGQNRAADLGALLIAIAVVLTLLFAKYGRERALGAATLFFLFASLGDFITGIAADKLLWFSGAFALIALVSVFTQNLSRSQLALPLIVAIGLAIANAKILGEPGSQVSRKRRTALTELGAVLGQPGYDQWRYVTLGLGTERFALARNLRVGSLDAAMPWLLPTEELRGTRFYSIDELPLGETSAQKVLDQVLAHANQHAVRWVISADDRASPLLEQHGYVLRSAWKGDVILWSKDSIAPARAVPRIRTISAILWGIIPPLSLGVSMILLLLTLSTLLGDRPRRMRSTV